MKRVGTWMLPDQEQHLEEWINRAGDYQTPHRENALKHVTKWDCAIDVGGHVGLWSRDFCLKFKEVHAFEPVAEHRECFVENVKGNYTLHPVALGDKEGFVKMATEAHSTGGTHIDPGVEGDIPLKVLDSYNLSPDFMKLDCEGYEIYVLKGAVETLLRCKPIICIEQKPHSYFGNPQYAAGEYLMSLGAKPLSAVVDDIVFGW